MRTQRYPSDLTDEQWKLVEPLIPVYPGGRPRSTSMRDVLDAILYVLRTGCQWRYLPKDFPPKSTVWGYCDEWRHNGTWIRSTTPCATASARRRSPGGRGAPPASTASRWTPAPAGRQRAAGTSWGSCAVPRGRRVGSSCRFAGRWSGRSPG